ncbi:MAG: class I SAM-dependent RNA methyltransferase [Acidobacteria bacterium]|nr:class I SAM-dependent RNA methyltransferase [Acidobacteriota bacterium]
MTQTGELLTLAIERPAVGGRMIARHGGAVVLVAGAIPGERVTARVERVQRRTVFARTVEVLEASPDRVAADAGLACGGHVFAHIDAPRQAALKAEMIADAFRRQGRLEIEAVPVSTGPADGYRTRARVHVRRGRWGFFEDGSHALCDITASRQLRPESAAVLDRLCGAVAADPNAAAEVEWAESVDGTRRVAHVALTAAGAALTLAPADGLDGASWSDVRGRMRQAWGEPFVVDTLGVAGGAAATVDVRHHVRAFFQGNRYLLQALVDDVVGRVTAPVVADLYAGVGLFSLVLAAQGRAVEAVEGDDWAAGDLQANGGPTSRVHVHHRAVESYVQRTRLDAFGAVVVDPPRTGLAPEVTTALVGARVPRVVYVSCDPATLARDVRLFVDGGYAVRDMRAFDLFPRTAHVETVLTLTR